MGVDPQQLLAWVVRPALQALALPGGELAEKLVMGTAAQESRFQYLHQLGAGPALSLWQVEPVTAMDTLRRAPAEALDRLDAMVPGLLPIQSKGTFLGPIIDQLPGNLYLGAAMCRLVYFMKPFPWGLGKAVMTEKQRSLTGAPAAATRVRDEPLDWCSGVWKFWFNSTKGDGTEAEFIDNWRRFKLNDLWKGEK